MLRKIKVPNWMVPFLALLAALAMFIFDPGLVMAGLRDQVFDQYQRIAPRDYVDPKTTDIGVSVRYIDIDDKSLEALGQWPWPRTYVAQLVINAFEAGALVVVFDVVFAEPDRTSPRQVVPLWPQTEEVAAIENVIEGLPDHDQYLADILSQVPVVMGHVLVADDNGLSPVIKTGFAEMGDDPRAFLPPFAGAIRNLDLLEEAAVGNGSFNLVASRDTIVRSVPLVLRHKDQLVPSLGIEALRLLQGAGAVMVKSSGANMEESFGASTGIAFVRVGHKRFAIPTLADGQMRMHFTGPRKERVMSAADLFDPGADKSKLENAIVYIGTSAAGLLDLRSTPIESATAGVEIHVEAMEQMLLGHFLSRPDWAGGAEILFVLIFGLFLILLIQRTGPIACAAVAVGGLTGVIGFSWYLYQEMLFLLDPVGPSLAVTAIFMTGTLTNFLRTESERRQVRGAFGQYLSPALVEQLADDPDRLALGGEMKEMTFLFCDVRGFTAISESFKGNPQGLTVLINRLLTPLTNEILDRDGTIDKYMGDCIMAFWNAPLDVDNQEVKACQSALAMLSALDELNAERKAEAEADGEDFLELKIGLGINTGECVVGNMGSEQRFDYSVLGDAVNLAARLEGQSKTYGVYTVLGPDTAARVGDQFAVISLDLIAVKGRSEAADIYGLLGDKAVMESADFKALNAANDEMIAAYRAQDWDKAEALIEELRKNPLAPQGLYDLYQDRINDYRIDPPAEDWNGVFVATTK